MANNLNTHVSVTITATSVTITRAGFGTPLVAGYHTVFGERVRSYTSTTDMVTDGFGANDPIVRAVQAILSQDPHPTTVKVGRRALAFSQSIDITPVNTTEDFVYGFTVISPDGTSTSISYTVLAAATPTTIATALQPLFDAITDLTCTDNTGSITCAADNNGELFDIQPDALTRRAMDMDDGTADPGIATDLAAIELEDGDWYGLALDSNSKLEIAAAAAWVEAQTKIMAANTADADVLDDTAGNIMETLEAAAYGRTFCIFSANVLSYAGAAWLGKQLPTDAGSSTWAYKTLAGVTRDDLTATEITNVESNNGNHYQELAGVNITFPGTMADGEFIDIQRTIDALTARIQEDIATILVNQPKLPYTDASVTTVKGAIRGALRSFQDDGALDAAVDPIITAPKVSEVSSADRANRLLPDVEFEAQLAGAIHKTTIAGRLIV